MKIIYEFFKCEECPYCKKGHTYGNDGRDGKTVFICSKGAFGGYEHDGYAYGKEITEGIDEKCPLKDINS